MDNLVIGTIHDNINLLNHTLNTIQDTVPKKLSDLPDVTGKWLTKNGDILPVKDNTVSLGSVDKRLKSLYVSDVNITSSVKMTGIPNSTNTNKLLYNAGTGEITYQTDSGGGTTYSNGTGLNLVGTEFSIIPPIFTNNASNGTTITGTYPNFIITDGGGGVTYTQGTGVTISTSNVISIGQSVASSDSPNFTQLSLGASGTNQGILNLKDFTNIGTDTIAQIRGIKAGTNGGDLHIFTKVDGGSLTEKLTINDTGAIGIGAANYGNSGQVLTSNGSGSAVSWGTPFDKVIFAVRGTGTQTMNGIITSWRAPVINVYNTSWNSGTGYYTIPESGNYRISFRTAIQNTGDTSSSDTIMYKNGIIYTYWSNITSTAPPGSPEYYGASIEFIDAFSVNDEIYFRGSDPAGTFMLDHAFFSVQRIYSPSSTGSSGSGLQAANSFDFRTASINASNEVFISGTKVGEIIKNSGTGTTISTQINQTDGMVGHITEYFSFVPKWNLRPTAGSSLSIEIYFKLSSLNAGERFTGIFAAFNGGENVQGGATDNFNIERGDAVAGLQFWASGTTTFRSASNSLAGFNGTTFAHLVCTYDHTGTGLKQAYLDGSLVTPDSSNNGVGSYTYVDGVDGNYDSMFIGRHNWNIFDNGVEYVRYLRHYTKVLSSSEVTTLYNNRNN